MVQQSQFSTDEQTSVRLARVPNVSQAPHRQSVEAAEVKVTKRFGKDLSWSSKYVETVMVPAKLLDNLA